MRKCRPSKWVPWAFVGAGLPLLAAGLISTGGLKSEVVDRAKATLAADESLNWANVDLNGRVATLTGTSSSQKAIDAAVAAVAGTYGVRTVNNLAVFEPVKLVAPTIESITVETATPEIRGTWPEGPAKTLTVTVAGTPYTLPGSPELTSDAGNWLLKLANPLAEGTYEVTAVASDGAEASQAAEKPGQVVVKLPPPAPEPAAETPAAAADVTPPAAPVVTAVAADATANTTVSGTWPEGDATGLSVLFQGREYVLGRGSALARSNDSDGKPVTGSFVFSPNTARLAPGKYDVEVIAKDAAGNIAKAAAPQSIIIPEPPKPPVTPEPAAADLAPPAIPVVAAIAADAVANTPLTGTWPEGDATRLAAVFQGREYVLGRGSALTRGNDAEGKPAAGTFVFAPNTARLAPGKYDVEIIATDAAGNVSKAMAAQSIIIPEAAKPAATPAATPEATPAAATGTTLAAPTVQKQLDLTGAPVIRGTWPEGEGTTLTVTVGGKDYAYPGNPNIASDGKGGWRLLPASALKDGTYDVVVKAAKGDVTVRDETVGELEVDSTVPATPTIEVYASNEAPKSVSGTYDAKQARSLTVKVPELNLSAELGTANSPLSADEEGKWTLALPAPMAPGTYNVVVTSADERGRVAEAGGKGEIIISAQNEAAPKTDQAFSCDSVMGRISAVFPMRFVFAQTDFEKQFALSVNQYAALLQDPRCATLKVEVGGHADSRGSDRYNEDLAERRAKRVRDMLTSAGIAADRLTVASYGESMPLDPAETEEAWAKNRRVEVKILK